MTALCEKCGTPLGATGESCPSCGAVAATTAGSSLKVVVILAVLSLGGILLAAGTAFYLGQVRHAPGSSKNDAAMLLTKEEVGAIIGVPVTSIEMQGKQDALYKTATMGMQASIDFERKDDDADAVQSMAAERKVTQSMSGGKAAPVSALGDEAVYGASNVLYVRKNDVVLTITPPNLQQAAALQKDDAAVRSASNEYETKSREMARQMAEKVLAKL